MILASATELTVLLSAVAALAYAVPAVAGNRLSPTSAHFGVALTWSHIGLFRPQRDQAADT